MNAADLATAFTVFGCAGAAGLVAASEKAGSLTVLFVFVGLAVGFGFALVVRKLAYRLLDLGSRRSGAGSGWQMIFAYTVVPMLAAFGAIAATAWLTLLLVRQLS